MLKNNNQRTRVRVRRGSRQAAAKKRRNTILLVLLGLTSLSAIAAMFGATPTGKYVASLMKERASRIFAEPAPEQRQRQSIESLQRKTASADADEVVFADRSVVNPLALPTVKDTYPDSDGKNWDVDALISRKRSPEDSGTTDPMNPERYGLDDEDGGSLFSTSLWAAVSYEGDTGSFFGAATGSSRSGSSGSGFGRIGLLPGSGIMPSGNPGDKLELYTLEQTSSGNNNGSDSLFDEPGVSGSDVNNDGQQGNGSSQQLPLFDVSQIAPNDEPLTPPTSEDELETVATGSADNDSIEVSEPGTIAIFGFAALYLFGLRRSLNKQPASPNAAV